MELANAVISLALLVKQQADDAKENLSLCESLSSRAEMIPRLLDKFPDKANLDQVLLSRILEQLKSCHDLISHYRKKGAIMKFIKAGAMKTEFQDLEMSLGKSIDDLTLAVGVSSAIVLDSIRNNFQDFFRKFHEEHHLSTTNIPEDTKEIEQMSIPSYFIPPEQLSIGEIFPTSSLPQLPPLRSRGGLYKEKSITVQEYLVAMKDEEISSLLQQVMPLLNFLCHTSPSKGSQVARDDFLSDELCPIIGWGYSSVSLNGPSSSSPNTLITLYIVFDALPPNPSLVEFMKSYPIGISDSQILLQIGYSLIKYLTYFHYQCSFWEKNSLVNWPRGVFFLPHNIRVISSHKVMCFAFDSFLPYTSSSSFASQSNDYFYFSFHRLLINNEFDFRETYVWCAPEQMKASSIADIISTPASEIYTFGLILSYLSTGRSPHNADTLTLQELREHVRQGKPQNTPRDGSLLSEIINYCLAPDPTTRPDAKSLYQILYSLCQENKLHVIPLQHTTPGAGSIITQKYRAESSEDENSECGLADFGDLADKVEQVSQSIKLFGPSIASNFEVERQPIVLLYGTKVVLLNLPVISEANLKVNHGDDEEEEIETSQKKIAGIVIFHIDNTASMKKDNRMGLVKSMLLAVIPKYIRLNYYVIINSWSSNETTKGKIQVCRALNSIPPNLLDTENYAEYERFMEETLFKVYLEPNGRTDLFGSCYQLLTQIEEELQQHHLPVYSLILTDGNHNRLDYPHHLPKSKDEEYFGVYKATLNNGTKFGINPGVTFDVKQAEQFLKKNFDSLQSLCGAINRDGKVNTSLTLVIIGIGEASTKSLSSLADSFGERCSFYGITCTEEILPLFNSITEASGIDNQVTLSLANSSLFSFRYLFENSDTIVGCHLLDDQSLAEKLHNSPEISIGYKTHSFVISETIDQIGSLNAQSLFQQQIEGKNRERLKDIVKEVVSILSKLRQTPYEVNSHSFTTIFNRLQADKKIVASLKVLHSSKKLRNYRNLSIYLGLGAWIREIDEMIESQIAAYRMNVETTTLFKLEDGKDEKGKMFEPSEVVLERLQNNLRNTGRAVHKVTRHVSSIQTLRDRTISLAGNILSSNLSLQSTSDGLALRIVHPNSGKNIVIEWLAPSSMEVELELVKSIQSSLLTQSFDQISSNQNDRNVESKTQYLQQMLAFNLEKEVKELSFPCILLRANFDPFTIIKNTSLFNLTALFPSFESSNISADYYHLNYPVYCMEEIWDILCYSSRQYLPGQDFPVVAKNSTAFAFNSLCNKGPLTQSLPNMVLALGHTPLLFNLYLERSCLYQSCLNVTGDLMAYASTTYQWAKVFYDCLYFVHHVDSASTPHCESPTEFNETTSEILSLDDRNSILLTLKRSHLEVALISLVSYSYACESRQTYPSKNTVYEMLGQDQSSDIVAEFSYKVFARETLPGLTCSLAFSTLLATSQIYPLSRDPITWNSLVCTLFSRFCEAISGMKVIRNNNPSITDLREIEDTYRLCVGQLQSTLQRRLYVEWPKLTVAEKLHILSSCAGEVVQILQSIVTNFLDVFDRYGLPLWSEMIHVVESCLYIQRIGICNLREMYISLNRKILMTIDQLVNLKTSPSRIILPVVRQHGTDITLPLTITELDPRNDLEHILAYVEAILATKVSPKIEYKPVTRPQHPTIDASVNRDLRVTSLLSSWNTDNPVVNIGLIGNVNSGKSTLSGRILADLGLVNQKLLDRLSAEASRLGYSSDLKHAWILDKLQAERSQNVTIVPKYKGFQTSLRRYNLIDNPGHKDFLTNVTGGIFHSDIALLLVSGVESERTVSGLVSNYMEEFLINAFCYSIKNLIVIVNKMDAAGYSETEFNSACENVKKNLKKAGYKVSNNNVQFIPVSALTGEGIVSTSGNMPWYTGPCLLQMLDEVIIPKRHSQKPLRMVVGDIFKVSGVGVVLCGKVECGSLSVGDTLACYPELNSTQSRTKGKKSSSKPSEPASVATTSIKVRSIESHHINLTSATAGDDIGIAVAAPGLSSKSFAKGMILTHSSLPGVPVFIHFEAQLIILKKCTIRCGYRPTLLINASLVPVQVVRLISIIDKNNAVVESSPTSVTQSQICICEMIAQKPFAAETIHENPKLSKFLIRESRLTVAIGFIRGPVA